MNKITTIGNLITKVLNDTFVLGTLLLSIFFLPLNLFLNNLFFTIFFATFFLKTILFDGHGLLKGSKKNWVLLLILTSPLLISVIGSFYASNLNGVFKDLGRLFPLALVVPLIYYQPTFFNENLKRILVALALGALVAALICWGSALFEIFQNKGSIGDLFTQPYAYHFLSERVGIHTPYLGLFVAISIFFLILEVFNTTSKKQRLIFAIWALVLFLFLLNLLARTAIITLLLGVVFLLINRKKYLILLISVAGVALLGTLAYQQDHNFLRDRIFKSINIFEEQTIFSKKDDRFSRFNASIAVFKQFPVLGPGTASENEFRKEIYLKNRDSEAYNDNYNAHNQLLEYLSTFGLMGGVAFILIVYLFIKEAIIGKNAIVLFLVFSFLMASTTESILERSWGVSFYILVIMVINGNKKLANETS